MRNYAEDYSEGFCDIYFMRDIKKQDKSLVTVEVQKKQIVQSRLKNNKDPNEEQIKFLNKWEDKILQKIA